MPLRVRKRIGGVTFTPRGASLRIGGRRAGVTASTRGVSGSLRLLPGVSLWKRFTR